MVFNWFRRQHNDTPEQQPQGETPPAPETQPEPAAETTPETEDLLAFAKAAYKNIQQKQQSQIQAPATVSEDTPEVISKETATPIIEETTEIAAIEEISVTEDITPVAVIEENTEIAAIEEISVTEDITPVAVIEENTEITAIEEIPVTEELTLVAAIEGSETSGTETPVSETQPALSFLERAAAERQAKQERLIANAIEVEEPETTLTPASTTANVEVEIPELEFDDGFVWSVEVLAAQGRKAEDVSIEEITWLKKLRQSLDKTRRNILNQLKSIVGQGPLNQAAVAEIEALLLQADVGVEATDFIIDALQKKLRDEVTPPEEAIAFLKKILRDMLDAPNQVAERPSFAPDKENLTIWLITGVNGAGKTTTIGKIAHLAQKSGYKCLIGAADTFRAAAVEQVKVWGSRSGVEVIANPGKNTDPAAVVFDAIAAAQSRGTELLLIDTAGRLQNKKNLMDELSKIRKIIDKKAPNAHIESLLVLDSTLGQNGLRQAEVFSQAAQLSGVVLTKLDGTAKGGVALAVVQQLGLPIRFIGAGEGIEDLRPFSSYEFVEALLNG
ncbi:signal recognition particle-docking protein FtsY [Anabaena cylindrica FACHB-243]|uniref:Signal recognition particle receptor FtsY n=1 Tax=Anabaena cylindrica (strain ATCC 27899 / PCC 7122) TaxID=272123 RepID=K9ZCK0_ANACC|nr:MULTISPECIES: signal recognition particle-docking protein FtsY [Anabaena]AFZ56449.1 signal recognition particle-docking protein FtsY [Anabaena cylindrica PCC 7122]MBD2418101.1 signal recognition particle-docking protein FtsY [Anabaena cylindrica FACHB-243]MBY5281946.1 signal recognition particle-docking protein FtsY [Anabaena sp. CCAP 1446/1C]MBY5310840.1 signal recognition particle-docking protein FtsY [Anabaena sp. CCAP 1446/1C]BAY01105.1 signal recognition particle-docking protein FtsY [